MDITVIIVVVIVTALAFDFTNGFHDTGNAMATSIATGALQAPHRGAHRGRPEPGRRVPPACGVPEVGLGPLTSGDRRSDMIPMCRCGWCT